VPKPEHRSILTPNAPPRPSITECPVCTKDHTSWSGCWLAELGSVLQDRGFSTVEIAEAMHSIPNVQDLYDRFIGPAVDAVEAFIEELCEKCGTKMEDRGDGPECPSCAEQNAEAAYDRQQERLLNSTPPAPFTMADKDAPERYRP
jgi:hypothetical protein